MAKICAGCSVFCTTKEGPECEGGYVEAETNDKGFCIKCDEKPEYIGLDLCEIEAILEGK